MAARRRTTGCSSKPFCTDIEPAFHGVICLSVSAIGDCPPALQPVGESGVFERIFKLLSSDHDNEYMMIDATIVRAHHTAPERENGDKRSADPAAD